MFQIYNDFAKTKKRELYIDYMSRVYHAGVEPISLRHFQRLLGKFLDEAEGEILEWTQKISKVPMGQEQMSAFHFNEIAEWVAVQTASLNFTKLMENKLEEKVREGIRLSTEASGKTYIRPRPGADKRVVQKYIARLTLNVRNNPNQRSVRRATASRDPRNAFTLAAILSRYSNYYKPPGRKPPRDSYHPSKHNVMNIDSFSADMTKVKGEWKISKVYYKKEALPEGMSPADVNVSVEGEGEGIGRNQKRNSNVFSVHVHTLQYASGDVGPVMVYVPDKKVPVGTILKFDVKGLGSESTKNGHVWVGPPSHGDANMHLHKAIMKHLIIPSMETFRQEKTKDRFKARVGYFDCIP